MVHHQYHKTIISGVAITIIGSEGLRKMTQTMTGILVKKLFISIFPLGEENIFHWQKYKVNNISDAKK
jgi:hypothetical protein